MNPHLSTATAYHRATSYRRNDLTPHTLDWANQPAPVKRYPQLPRVSLRSDIALPEIDYIDHAQGAEQMKDFFPGVRKEQLPGGLGWALEFIKLTTHSGTHLDAPYHYHPTMDSGTPSMTITKCLWSGAVTMPLSLIFAIKTTVNE